MEELSNTEIQQLAKKHLEFVQNGQDDFISSLIAARDKKIQNAVHAIIDCMKRASSRTGRNSLYDASGQTTNSNDEIFFEDEIAWTYWDDNDDTRYDKDGYTARLRNLLLETDNDGNDQLVFLIKFENNRMAQPFTVDNIPFDDDTFFEYVKDEVDWITE